MEVRYIKLGSKGKWEGLCLFEENSIQLGYESKQHQQSLDGNWDAVRAFWLDHRKGDEGAATRDVNQIKDFYELSESTIWITFHKRKMYWCRAHEEVEEIEHGYRRRQVVGKWSCQDSYGNDLTIENIDGRITQVQAYRGTICTVNDPAYVERKILGQKEQNVIDAEKARENLRNHIEKLIEGLWWYDFELLIDLIFSKSGWQRVSALGKTEKDIDLDVMSPLTHRRVAVQIKSKAGIETAKTYYERLKPIKHFDNIYFVCHSLKGNPKDIGIKDDRFVFWGVPQIAKLVIETGLIDWLITKRS